MRKRIDIAKESTRWIALLSLIGLALLYLNSTAFSLWVSGGPPTESPKVWSHRGVVHFGFSVALFATAVFVFKILKPGFSFKGKKILYVWLAIVMLAIGYPLVKEILLVDACLDSGGEWSETYFECNR